jgi:hypothetical protein
MRRGKRLHSKLTSDMSEKAYDLLISHADADRAWVDGFLIPELGLDSDRIIRRSRFRLGVPFIEEAERAVRESHATGVVITPALFDEFWPQLEERLASYASVSGETRLISVFLGGKPARLT